MINFEFRRRPIVEQPIEDLHAFLIQTAGVLPADWALSIDEVKAPDIGRNLVAVVELPILNNAVTQASIQYQLRKDTYLRDEALYDDLLLIQVNARDIDVSAICHQVFVPFLDWFSPYRARVTLNPALNRQDWTSICALSRESGLDVNGRDSVFRIYPWFFIDRELCLRSFQREPEELVATEVESGLRIEVHSGGLLFSMNKLLCFDEETLNSIDLRAKQLIGPPIVAIETR
ncbi:hypothetical protein [Maricaulis sp. MIT060901]|uniref:hypothetical protein n=1 Tax=Maricaulis sp. MIT060901 TaxID=3096993 RepID=UPI00399C223B